MIGRLSCPSRLLLPPGCTTLVTRRTWPLLASMRSTVRASWRVVASAEVVALVAHHTGPGFEAEERGLLDEWRTLPCPDPRSLDVLTMIDLSVGPAGHLVVDRERVAEIRSRYAEDDPVYRAVSRSAPELIKASLRASDSWLRRVRSFEERDVDHE